MMSDCLSVSAIASIDATEPGVVKDFFADLHTGVHVMARLPGAAAGALAGVWAAAGVPSLVAST